MFGLVGVTISKEDTIYDGLASEFLGDERTERLRERREHQERIRHKARSSDFF